MPSTFEALQKLTALVSNSCTHRAHQPVLPEAASTAAQGPIAVPSSPMQQQGQLIIPLHPALRWLSQQLPGSLADYVSISRSSSSQWTRQLSSEGLCLLHKQSQGAASLQQCDASWALSNNGCAYAQQEDRVQQGAAQTQSKPPASPFAFVESNLQVSQGSTPCVQSRRVTNSATDHHNAGRAGDFHSSNNRVSASAETLQQSCMEPCMRCHPSITAATRKILQTCPGISSKHCKL